MAKTKKKHRGRLPSKERLKNNDCTIYAKSIRKYPKAYKYILKNITTKGELR